MQKIRKGKREMGDLVARDIEVLIRENFLFEKPEYFSEEEWNSRISDIEGSQFDLTIDKLYSHTDASNPYLGRYSRDTGRLVELHPIEFTSLKETGWQLYEDTHYIGLTGETINMPSNLRGVLAGRSSDFVIGIYPGVTNVSPGYSGKLKFGLYVTRPMKLGRGARIITATFRTFSFYCNTDNLSNEYVQPYNGVWGKDKVTTEGVERPS